MASVTEPGVAGRMSAVRAWAGAALRRLSVALVYGGVSDEDQLYISDSPVEQLSVTALAETLGGLGVRFRVLDPCRPSFVRDVAGFDVVLSNLHGPFGEDGRLQGLLDYLRVPSSRPGVLRLLHLRLVHLRAATGLVVLVPVVSAAYAQGRIWVRPADGR
jgi:hypothetical protein